jgi:hypothetical protein
VAAATLVKMAKTASDSEMAANLVRVTANLTDSGGELPPSVSIEAPDVQSRNQMHANNQCRGTKHRDLR